MPRVYDETYDGGQHFIRLRHRPVIQLIAVSEFRGPIEYTQSLVADPAHGNIYSVEIDTLNRIVRRSAGGGIIAFPAMPQSIHVVYEAGYLTIPPNVTHGTLELIKFHFTGQQGRPRLGASAVAGDFGEPEHEIMGFFVPQKVREILQANRRHSAIA